jgi:hypothetical protein
MRENRQLIWLLVIYILAQIASLYVGAFALIYLLVYLMALVAGSRVVYISTINKEPAKKLLIPFLLFFVANLIPGLIYIPTLLLNPEINWRLKGEYEVDPMILQIFVPLIFFLAAMIVLFTVTVITRLKRRAA